MKKKFRSMLTKALTVLVRRLLRGRNAWKWHHKHMRTNPPYERILIQGVGKALRQETFNEFVTVLAKTVVQLGKHLKHGTDQVA